MEVVMTVEDITKRRVNMHFLPRRAGDPPILVADATAAEKSLGWSALRPLEQMIQSAWNWMQNRSLSDGGRLVA
jgi:UDP-glucose 4-epimerase